MRIERAWWIGLFLGAVAALGAACGDESSNTTGGLTSSSSGTGAGGTGGTGGGGGSGGLGGDGGGTPPECMTASDCKNNGDANFCGAPACESGKCVRKALQPVGTPLPSQTYGDCVEKQCDPNGDIVDANKDDDIFNDGQECTEDVCMNGVLMHSPSVQGTLCISGGVCNDMGSCVQCIEGVQGCTGGFICIGNVCAGPKCNNATKDPGEGDVDCGGNCPKCDDAKSCTLPAQCKSGICTANQCAAPSCNDTVPNGKETGVDCGGGECPACPTDSPCFATNDCVSGVCFENFCAAPSCTDAVQNGDEGGIDCGGACPATCPN